jgi:hypothetical protein
MFEEFCRTRRIKLRREHPSKRIGRTRDRTMKNRKCEYYYLAITTKQALRAKNETLMPTI